MKIIKLAGFALLILFGAFMIVYGGIDDSPGGQLLGLISVVFGSWMIFKLLSTK